MSHFIIPGQVAAGIEILAFGVGIYLPGGTIPFLFAQFHPARPYICLMVLISTQQIRAIESTKTGVVHYEYKSLETQKKQKSSGSGVG